VLRARYAGIRRLSIIITPRLPCAKFRFCHVLHCWASPWRKIAYSINHSLTHL